MLSNVVVDDAFVCCCVALSCWFVWKARCEFITIPDLISIYSKVQHVAKAFVSA